MANTKVPPADRFCDLVMKGGITSGVVYPRAIMHFAQHYRLKNIGGTSAGAIAAVAAAAAEYRRRHVAAGQALPRPKIPKWTGYSGVQPIPPRVGVADELLGFARLAISGEIRLRVLDGRQIAVQIDVLAVDVE